MTVLVGGIERHVWPVSTGLRAYDTPVGNYTARSMNEIWYSREWDDAPMPHAIFFTRKGHAIHGTEDRKKLGRPASHGCVRLAPENARTLFALVKRHGLAKTAIVLSGELPRAEAKAAPKPATAKKPVKAAADKKKPDAKPSHARAKAKPEQAAKRRAAEKTQEEKKPKAAKRQASPPKQAARPRRYDPYAIGPPRRLTRQEWLRLYYGYAPPPPRGYYGPPPRRYWRDY